MVLIDNLVFFSKVLEMDEFNKRFITHMHSTEHTVNVYSVCSLLVLGGVGSYCTAPGVRANHRRASL